MVIVTVWDYNNEKFSSKVRSAKEYETTLVDIVIYYFLNE